MSVSNNQFSRHSFSTSSNTFSDSSNVSSNAFSATAFPSAENVWGGDNTGGGAYGDVDGLGDSYNAGAYGGISHFLSRTTYSITR